MKIHPFLAALSLLVASLAHAEEPIIDMHVHASLPEDNGPLPAFACVPFLPHLPPPDPARPWPMQLGQTIANPPCDDQVETPATAEALRDETIARLRARNAIAVLSGPPERVMEWVAAAPDRFIPSLQLRIGRDPYDADQAARYFLEDGFAVLGEVSNQYAGIAPDDPRMMEFWAMAEANDIPVGIHMGSGPPGASVFFPDYRVALGNPLLLEEVLARHPGLRISVMHMADGFTDEMKAMLWAYPQLYVEISANIWGYGEKDFRKTLLDYVDAGFGGRILFGSDGMNWPGIFDRSVDIIENADYLTEEQKRDILFNNAVRFMKLDPAASRSRALGETGE